MWIFILILFFVGIAFIGIKVNDLKNRAKQQLLRNTGVSSSEISASFSNSMEKRHLQKFLEEHTNFTEESIKDLLRQYTTQIINKQSINEFTQAVYEKIQKDSKLEKMKNMEFKRTYIIYYKNSRLNAAVVYADNRDEYEIHLFCSILENSVQLDKYQISKGSAIGF